MSIFRKSTSIPIDYQARAAAAADWAMRSIKATGSGGSAHSWSPLFGWAKPYPETTGYLIETLLRWSQYCQPEQSAVFQALALQAADWLLALQLPSGAFPGLLAGHQKPSVFNTAQIMFGLAAAYEQSQQDKYRQALARAGAWLAQIQEADGAWRQAAYVEGFVPTYYTRAVQGLLRANQSLRDATLEQVARKALLFYAEKFQAGHSIQDWGFWPGKPAYTHTIAYTLEGLWQSAAILEMPDIQQKTLRSLETLQQLITDNQAIAGTYDENWKGNYRFECPTGNVQLALVFQEVGKQTANQNFLDTARALLDHTLQFQSLKKGSAAYGALPGSAPFYGPYLRFRYPNWGVKFLLDALIEIPRIL